MHEVQNWESGIQSCDLDQLPYSISCDFVCVAHIEGEKLSVNIVKDTVPLLALGLFISDALVASLFSHQH